MSAMSIERISNAVPESRPRSSTTFEIWSGFSSTRMWFSADPMVVTMPSPTRATIVSSVAPPTSRSRFVRTVTRAFTLSWIPSPAIASMVLRAIVPDGTSITFGLTEVSTASLASRPARSIAQHRS